MITMRQAFIIFMLACFSPAIRLFPQVSAKIAGKAGWTTPFVAVLPLFLLVYIVYSFFKKNKELNLSEIYFKILGKVVGKIVIFIYLIWILFLTSLYVRYYAERLLTSILETTSIYFIIGSLLILVFFAARMGIVPFARVNEAFFSIFIIIFLLLFIIGFSDIKYDNLMNISYKDIFPVTKASYCIYAIWGYFLYIFFFGDKIKNKDKLLGYGIKGSLILMVLTLLLMILTIGSLGSIVTSRVSLPFFKLVKNIKIFDVVEHLESLAISLWIISDFIIITMFVYIAANIIKSLFNLSDTTSVISPLVLFALVGAMFFYKNMFELETFSIAVLLPVNILMEFIVPLVVLCIGKIRKLC